MPGKKILVIDDEKKALELLKLNLEAYGFEVFIAASGQDGMSTAVLKKPDLIILDIRMPKHDGWDVCGMLKNTASTRNIPILFLTAFSSDRDQERAIDLGASAYLTKPVDPDLLVKTIKEVIETEALSQKHYKGETGL